MKYKALILAACLALASLLPARAQTNGIPNPLSTAESWVTTYNTNYDISLAVVKFDTGVKLIQGVTEANTINFDVTVHHFGAQTNWTVEIPADVDNAGIAGTVVDAGAGVQIGITKYDVELYGKLTAGDDFNQKSWFVRPAVGIYKLFTSNTYNRLEIGLPIEKRTRNIPEFTEAVGIMF